MAKSRDIYAGKDPRRIPWYSIAEAAAFVQVPPATVRAWTRGTTYGKGDARRKFQAVIPARGDLTFLHLVELHVLASVRRDHGVQMQRVRRAVEYVKRRLDVKRPLLEQEFETDGVSLFVERLGKLENASQDGQLAMRQVLEASLERIKRDREGMPIILFPWASKEREADEPKLLAVDPKRAHGRPTIAGTGIQAQVLADRFAAGDDPSELADEYDLDSAQVTAALRWQLNVAQAA